MIKITHTEATPNANALKFVTDTKLVASGALSYDSAAAAADQPLAKSIFDLGAINAVYIQDNFVSVNAGGRVSWDKVRAAIEEGLASFQPVEAKSGGIEGKSDDGDLLGRVNAVVDQFVRPALAGDGGGLEILGIDNKTVHIRYQGACGGCPSATAGTLMAIENLLRDQIDPTISVQAL